MSERNIDGEDLAAARVDILDRMCECGWVSGFAVANNVASIQFTEKGLVMMQELRELFTRHGNDFTLAESAAFDLLVRAFKRPE